MRQAPVLGLFARRPARGRRKLKPLEEWICDGCQRRIRNAEQGWVEWLVDLETRACSGFRIVHHRSCSPLGPSGGCDIYAAQEDRDREVVAAEETYLVYFKHKWLASNILSFIDPGPVVEQEYAGPRVRDLREWTELARRLMTPYYEEARLFMAEAARDGFFEGKDQLEIYLPSTLREVIDRYGMPGGQCVRLSSARRR